MVAWGCSHGALRIELPAAINAKREASHATPLEQVLGIGPRIDLSHAFQIALFVSGEWGLPFTTIVDGPITMPSTMHCGEDVDLLFRRAFNVLQTFIILGQRPTDGEAHVGQRLVCAGDKAQHVGIASIWELRLQDEGP